MIPQQNNTRETAEFDQYASTYTELLDDPMRNRFARDPLHFHRRKWLLIASLLKQAGVDPHTQRWLDVGCGRGELLEIAGSNFAFASGCDPSPEMLKADASFSMHLQPSMTELPFAAASIDFVTAVCVYHHVHGAARTLLTHEIRRVLAPGGLCCIIEHNPWNPVTQAIVKRCPVDVDAELLTARETAKILEHSGFQKLRTGFFLYLPESAFAHLAPLEKMLTKLPFGGQYAVLAQTPK
jgi:SAM-dependent methyltransferase